MSEENGDINADSGGEAESLEQLQDRLIELSEKHDKAMETIASLSNKSYVYVPRERQIQPFSGEPAKDGRSVDEFIEEVGRVIRARDHSNEDGVDFIFSLLKGSALEEVRLCMEGEPKTPEEIFKWLRGAYSDKRSSSAVCLLWPPTGGGGEFPGIFTCTFSCSTPST